MAALTARLGPLWAQASTAPSRLFKCFPSEGGILVPAIVKPAKGTLLTKWAPGGFNRSFATCMDIAPTFLDIIGVSLPSTDEGKIVHRGRPVHAMTGYSWASYFGSSSHGMATKPEEWAIYPADKAIGWEMHTQAALRKGAWKIVHMKKAFGGKAERDDDTYGWELFNVEADPGETTDLSGTETAKLAELLSDWEAYVVEYAVVWGPTAMDSGLTPDEAPELHENHIELQRTWLQAPNGQRPVI